MASACLQLWKIHPRGAAIIPTHLQAQPLSLGPSPHHHNPTRTHTHTTPSATAPVEQQGEAAPFLDVCNDRGGWLAELNQAGATPFDPFRRPLYTW